jgi:exodeoxyribonuclease VII large subunit
VARKPFDPSLAQGGLFETPQPPQEASEPRPISVSQAASAVRDALFALGRVRIEGEIGTASMGKHCFFSLKDPNDEAVVECAMWSSALARSEVKPQVGKRMIVEGRFDFYAPSGRCRLLVDRIRLVGEGDLEARFRALCESLRGLGYFDDARKRSIPSIPRGVAIITAAGSAALADCLKISGSRMPSIPIRVVHVPVQGPDAAPAVASAIERVNAHAERLGVDVIVVTRGGGSREDLQAFNERAVADAAFRSRLPLVAAIGHESDTSVIELVADLRASTPTQAMVAVVPDREELRAQLSATASRLASLVRQGVVLRRQRARGLALRACLRDPRELLVLPSERLARTVLRLRHALSRASGHAKDRLREAEALLQRHAPVQALAIGAGRRQELARRLLLAMRGRMTRRSDALRSLEARLESVAPERTLARGYSITLDDQGRPVRDPSALGEGQSITTRLERGTVRSRVERAG